jgi:hypothetical protein
VQKNFSLIKVDWLDDCIALMVVGALFLFFSSVGVIFAQPLAMQWEARADTWKKSTKPF